MKRFGITRWNRALFAMGLLFAGCHVQPPGGPATQPHVHGTWVDEINRQQEENAELAKMIVYAHEFESNVHDDLRDWTRDGVEHNQFRYKPEPRPYGFRLTPDGQDHVRQIAKQLLGQTENTGNQVIVERSRTSKKWDTRHRYPVHFNDELDAIRRDVVVAALTAFGVDHADELVIVAPAYPTGLGSVEAAAAYSNAFERSAQYGNRSGTSRR